MYLEGRHSVLEALRARMPLKRILLAEGLQADTNVDEIVRRADEAQVTVVKAPRRQLDSISERGAHQGVIAEARPFKFAKLDQVLKASEGEPNSLVIALDHVTDPGNLGAVARTAEVVGASALLITERRSASITPGAWKAAAGALAHVPVVQETNLARALEKFKEAGYWIAGASEQAKQLAWDAPLEGRIVLVMGAEGTGLARLTKDRCDFLVKLPQVGEVGSLNVAQATTALAYEWVRRTMQGGSGK